jgi:hypothetical protein
MRRQRKPRPPVAIPKPEFETAGRVVTMRPYAVWLAGGGLPALIYCRSIHWSNHMHAPAEWKQSKRPPAWLTTWGLILADLRLVPEGTGTKERKRAQERVRIAVRALERANLICVYPCPADEEFADIPSDREGRRAGRRQRIAIAPLSRINTRYDVPSDAPVSGVVVNAVRLELVAAYGIDCALVLCCLLWRNAIYSAKSIVRCSHEVLRHQTGLSPKRIKVATALLVEMGALQRVQRPGLFAFRQWAIHPELIARFPPDPDAVKRERKRRKELRETLSR